MPAPPTDPHAPPPGDDAAGARRTALVAEFGVYSPAEAARRAGSRGHSPTIAVKRWQAAGRIFAVPVAGSDHFLGFCFDSSGRPRPAIGSILRSVAGRSSGWDLAMWFAAPNERLGGVRPVDALDGDGQRLAAAAAADMAAPDDQPPPQ